jgi:4-hydroxybenzoate polyprenyltransferase
MGGFWAYLQERFPPQANAVLIASYFTANYLLAHSVLTPTPRPLEISWRFPAGCIVLLLMFFHMRVIDEHKDYEQDLVVHPGRVLSRGLVTLAQLRAVGLAGAFVELALSAVLGLPALLMALVIFLFSWLTYREFFIGEFLKRHLLANAFLHLTIMPAYSLFVYSAATGRYFWSAPLPMLCYAWVSYGVGLGYELARKTRAPADERTGLITYSSVIGPYASALGVLLALAFSSGVSILVGLLMHFVWWYHATVAILLVLVALGVLHFRVRTTAATASNLQAYAGVFIFAFDILLAAALIHHNGLIWT